MEYQVINRALEEMKINDFLKENTLYLDCEIDRDTQVQYCRQLRKLATKEIVKQKDEQQHIKVRISSFGGMAYAMFAMISEMEYWDEKGIIIETYCDGYSASAGAKILMAGSKGYRFMTRYGIVVCHQSNGGNNAYTLQEKVEETRNSLVDWETVKSIFRKHSKLTEEDIFNFTDKNIDFTYRPLECIEKGIVDHII